MSAAQGPARPPLRPVERPWGGAGIAELGLVAPGPAVVGEWWVEARDFPLLVKLLDARENLSVQLHPDDEAARRLGLGSGKCEAWYVLRAPPGARLFLGVKDGVSDAEFMAAARRGDDLSLLMNTLHPAAGDVVFVPPGTVHAIGAGLVLLEVQQVSDTTFRLYDWGRQPRRELHLEQAAQCLRRDPRAGVPAGQGTRDGWRVRLADRLFEIAERQGTASTSGGVELWFQAAGRSLARHRHGEIELAPGDFLLLAAAAPPVDVDAVPGAAPSCLLRLRPGAGGASSSSHTSGTSRTSGAAPAQEPS